MKVIPTPIIPLITLLEEKNIQNVDLLTVDVEGMDLEVLKSNDWSKIKPRVVIVESVNFRIEYKNEDPVYTYLTEKNYELVSFVGYSLIFKLNLL